MRFKRASFLTKIVVLVLLIYLATSLLDLRGQIQSLQGELEGKEQQVADLRQENEEKSYAIENSDNPEVIEEVAGRRASRTKTRYCISTWQTEEKTRSAECVRRREKVTREDTALSE